MRIARNFGSLATVMLLVAGCGTTRQNTPAESADAWIAESADAWNCSITTPATVTPPERAARCAEWYVKRNGYTKGAGGLLPDAIVVCRGIDENSRPTYAVGFARTAEPASPTGRAVTMDTTFADMRLRYGGFPFVPAFEDTVSCRKVRKPAR